MLTCRQCGKELNRKKIFCCKKCNDQFHYYESRKEYKCKQCAGPCFTKVMICRKCTSKNAIAPLLGLCGKDNPNWAGGTKHWSIGRHGIDKNGLSWKTQRSLALERDNYTCQACKAKATARNPDVHHVIPWRVSYSHDLDNLLSLCKKCHKKEDQRFKNVHGLKDELIGRPMADKPYCKCGKRLRPGVGECRVCWLKDRSEKIDKYRDSGMSLREIAKEVKMNHESVRRHLQNRVKLLAK